MAWNRSVGVAAGGTLVLSAFLPWYRLDDRSYPATRIPALILFRYVDSLPSLRLGYLVAAVGVVVVVGSLIGRPRQGQVTLAAGAAALAIAVTFGAQLLRETRQPGARGAFLDYVQFGLIIATTAGVAAVLAGAGGLVPPARRRQGPARGRRPAPGGPKAKAAPAARRAAAPRRARAG